MLFGGYIVHDDTPDECLVVWLEKLEFESFLVDSSLNISPMMCFERKGEF